jgi:cell division protein FtsQ
MRSCANCWPSRSLGTDERGSWSATLQNGVVLRLGTGDALKKIRRFLKIYQDDLSRQLDQVAYVDLRYSNGLAVGWKQNNAVKQSGVGAHG